MGGATADMMSILILRMTVLNSFLTNIEHECSTRFALSKEQKENWCCSYLRQEQEWADLSNTTEGKIPVKG